MTDEHVSLAPREAVTNEELDLLWRVAQVNAASRRFPNVTKPEEAMATILLGRDLGLSPMQALTGISIVQGKPQTSAVTLGAFVRKGGTDYRVLQLDEAGCSIEFGEGKAPGKDEEGNWIPWPQSRGISTFTREDADQAKLGGKDNYQNYPRNMYFSRAMSNGVKWFMPEATHGMPTYTENEIPNHEAVDGSVDSEPLPQPAAAKPLNAAVLNDVPDQYRERLQQIFDDAQELRPGQLTRSAVHMSIRGANEQRINDFLSQQEARNTAAREALPPEPPDAEVVEESEVEANVRSAAENVPPPTFSAPSAAQLGGEGMPPNPDPVAPPSEPVRAAPPGATPQVAQDGPVPGAADIPALDGAPQGGGRRPSSAMLQELTAELENLDPNDPATEQHAAELLQEINQL